MNFTYCLNQLSANAPAIRHLIEGIDGDQARWKPAPDDWSILEVINHLVDEEREDFPARIGHLLSGAAGVWPPIAPQKWVTERAYNQRDLGESVANYLRERQSSLEWLRKLDGANWETRYQHPPLDGLTAGDLLVSWAAHDLLHLRQLIELKWAYGQTQCAPYTPRYAGEW